MANKLTVLIILFLFFLTTTDSVAQDDYQEGYIVTRENDTLYGRVSDRKLGPFGGIHEKIKFKGRGLRKRFAPKRLLAYKKGDSLYRTFNLGRQYDFYRLKSEGAVSHYAFELQEQGEQMVLDVEYLKKENSRTLVRADQGVFGLKRKRLSQFFADCPPLAAKIKNKEFKYVFEVVDYYNEWKKNQKTY